jgi:uncharacterized protein (TIGR02611 family)
VNRKPGGPITLARKVVKGIIGGLITLLGVVMLVTPGPGIIAILIGLSILATEFPSARRLLNKLRRRTAEPGE